MKPVIQFFHSLEMYHVDEDYVPEDVKNFGFTFEIGVGPEGTEATEWFTFFVCTAKWLLEHTIENEIRMGRHYLFMEEYNYAQMMAWLYGYVAVCEGDTWEEIAEKLSRLGQWEFEKPVDFE